MIRRQYITDAENAAKGPMVKAGQTAPSHKAPVKAAAAPAKATPANAATSAVKTPIGKTIKARKAATLTLKAQAEAKSDEKKKLPDHRRWSGVFKPNG